MLRITKCLKMIRWNWIGILAIAFSISLLSLSTQAKEKKNSKTTTAATSLKKAATRKTVSKTTRRQAKSRIPAYIPTKLPEKKIVEITFDGPINESELEPLDKSVLASQRAVKSGTSVIADEKIESRDKKLSGGISVQSDVDTVSVPDTQTQPENEQKVAVKMKSKSETWDDYQRSVENEMADY